MIVQLAIVYVVGPMLALATIDAIYYRRFVAVSPDTVGFLSAMSVLTLVAGGLNELSRWRLYGFPNPAVGASLVTAGIVLLSVAMLKGETTATGGTSDR